MDSSGGPLIGSIILILLFVIDFVLSGFGAALQTVSENGLEQSEKDGLSCAPYLKNLKDDPDHFIHACWFYSALSLSAGVILLCELNSLPAGLNILFVILIGYWFGKAVPQILGKKYSEVWFRSAYRFVQCFLMIALPFTYVLSAVINLSFKLFGINAKDLEDEVTEDEIISMVNEGHEQGVLDEHEAEMIQNIFELDDKEAQDIMTHRKNITAINGEICLADAINYMIEASNSRFPVYEHDINNIIGVLNLKDAVIFQNKGQYQQWLIKDIPELLRPVKFIPETRSISQLFRSMQAQKLQMVIVVDEYGETAGLVTMEDILEEIVGNILDEYDEEVRYIIREDDDTYRMDGMTPLQEVEDVLKIQLEEEDYETLNGYLVYKLDRIPDENEHSVIEEQGYSFRILSVEGKTIKWVLVKKNEYGQELTENDAAAESGNTEAIN